MANTYLVSHLKPCGFYLWDNFNFKDRIYSMDPHAEEGHRKIYKEQFWEYLMLYSMKLKVSEEMCPLNSTTVERLFLVSIYALA